MKTKNISIILVLIILVTFTSCANQKVEDSALKDVSSTHKEEGLVLKDIYSIEIYYYGTKKTTYTKDKNQKQIKEFIDTYNEAKPLEDEVGTTHSVRVIITLTNGEKITVWGGTQNFQTVQMNGKQFNIRGEKLWSYFKELNKQYSS